MNPTQEPIGKIMSRLEAIYAQAVKGEPDALQYTNLHQEILEHPVAQQVCPDYFRECDTGRKLKDFLDLNYPTYRSRREFIAEQLAEMRKRVRRVYESPMADDIVSQLDALSTSVPQRQWAKALERLRDGDFAGAITTARTLLESTCQAILQKRGVDFSSDKGDLPALYKRTIGQLGVTAGGHTKQLLSGLFSVAQAVAAARNGAGDAHGSTDDIALPTAIEAMEAVNAAGFLASSLVARHLATGKPASA